MNKNEDTKLIFMKNNNNLLKNFGDIYVVSEIFQDGEYIENIPVVAFDKNEDALFYVKNSERKLSIEKCKGIINHKSPFEKISYIYIEIDINSRNVVVAEVRNTNNFDVTCSEDINDIFIFRNIAKIKKMCPSNFDLIDRSIAIEIVNNIIDDLEIRIEKDYNIPFVQPNIQIKNELLKEFDRLF